MKQTLTFGISRLLFPLIALSLFTPGTYASPGDMDTGVNDSLPALHEEVKLSTQGSFTSLSPKVGDSLDYVLQVEWKDTEVPVIVLPPDSLSFQGFKILGQATVHKKMASGQDVRNHTEFIYRLRAQTQGNGRATSVKLRYLTGLSHSEEAIFVPTALVDILPAPTRLTDTLWFKLLGGLLLLGGAVALAWAAFRVTMRFRTRPEPQKFDLRPGVAELKNRIKSSASSPDAAKEISLAMEGLAIQFLRLELGKDSTQIESNEKFEPLLNRYLAGNGGLEPSLAQDWEKLRELFRHARFAGGYKEPHEIQDAFRTFKRCLKIAGEDTYE